MTVSKWLRTNVQDSGVQIGDSIPCGKYSATVQEVTVDLENGLIFYTVWLDQFLDRLYTHSEAVSQLGVDISRDPNFDRLPLAASPFAVHLPTAENVFGPDSFYQNCNLTGDEQWTLSRIRRNRLPNQELSDDIRYEPTWLYNEVIMERGCYGTIAYDGNPSFEEDGKRLPVRPVLHLVEEIPEDFCDEN